MSNARGFRHRSKERRLSSATRTNPTRRTTAGAGLSKLRAGPADTSQIARSMLHRYVQAAALRCTNSLSFVPQQPWQVEAQCCAVDRIESQHSAALTLAHRELATLRPSSSAYACTHQAETISVSAHVMCASQRLAQVYSLPAHHELQAAGVRSDHASVPRNARGGNERAETTLPCAR